MSKKERTLKKDTLIQALENSLGIVSTACNRTGISRSSYYKWYKEDEEFRQKVDEIDNVKLDFVESKLFKNIENEKEKSIIFYLQHKGHKRGYIQRQNINLTSNEEDIKNLNSKPNYHGYYIFFWCLIPSIIIYITFSISGNILIKSIVLSLVPNINEMSQTNIKFVYEQIQSMATGTAGAFNTDEKLISAANKYNSCLLYTSPSPRDS